MTDRNCMTFDEEDAVDDNEVITVYISDYVGEGKDKCRRAFQGTMKQLMDYFPCIKRVEMPSQDGSISHEDALRGSEIEKEGGSEGSNVSEAPGGSSGFSG